MGVRLALTRDESWTDVLIPSQVLHYIRRSMVINLRLITVFLSDLASTG